MSKHTDSDGSTESETVRALFQAYEDDADLDINDSGQIVNHDELVNTGKTFRKIQRLHRGTVEMFDSVEIVEPGHPLWCDRVADLGPRESVRVDELREDDDA